MIVEFNHYRVMKQCGLPTKGRPSLHTLVRYKRSGPSRSRWTPHEFGGKTVCLVYEGDDIVCTAESVCSMSDQFCYETGRRIALERARKLMEAYS